MMNTTSLFEFSSIDELEKQIFDKYNSDEEFKKEREKIYYRAFKLEDLFDRIDNRFSDMIKDLDTSDIKDKEHCIAFVSGTNLNNGIACYVKETPEINKKKLSCLITINAGFDGTAFYQKNEYINTASANSLKIKDYILKNACEKDEKVYKFICLELTKILRPFHSFGRKIKTGNDFNREIILLPVYKDSNNQEVISVKTLSYLYDRIKFNEYKQKIEKLERERYSIKKSLEIYENNLNFEEEKKQIFYKAFRVGKLFERSGSHKISSAIKDITTSDIQTEEFPIANITAASANNGAACFLAETDEVKKKKEKNKLTIAVNCNYNGICFYQDREFVSTGDNNFLTVKDKTFEKELDKNKIAYQFLAKSLTAIYMTKFHGWMRKLGNDFNREIILLPCYKDEDSHDIISTNKMESLYHKSVIQSKNSQITERENDQTTQSGTSSVSTNNLKISINTMAYLYIKSQAINYNKKAKQLQNEIIDL